MKVPIDRRYSSGFATVRQTVDQTLIRHPSGIARRFQRLGQKAIALLLVAAIALGFLGRSSLAADELDAPTNPLGEQVESTLKWPDVSGFLAISEESVSRQAVRLDGRRLFAIAVPQVSDRPEEAQPAESGARTRIIQDRLTQAVRGNFDPASLEVTYETNPDNSLPILYITSGEAETQTQIELMTVTTLDAQLYNTTPTTWAGELTQIVEAALLRARAERQPQFLRRQLGYAAVIGLVALVISLILRPVQQRLRRQRRDLSSPASQQGIEATPTSQTGEKRVTTALLQRQRENREKRRINEIERRLLQLAQAGIWSLGGFVVLGLFPYSRWLQPLILGWLQIPLQLLIVIVLTYLLIRSGEVLVDRLFWLLQDSASLAPELSQRATLRFSTFSRVVKSILTLVLVGAGIIVALSIIGVQVGPLLAGAGIIGLAVSFASQSVIKDMINGFLILLEDQYGVGDVITVGDVAGLVENMNLRITQLRNAEGRLITIPNSAITIVQNLSKEWARVDLTINVAYHADITQALQVIDQVAQDMSRDRPWQEVILEPPQLLGIDQLDHAGATIRLWIKTQPLKQWDVAREYRRRLKLAFDRADIPIGVPQQSLYVSNDEELIEHPAHHAHPSHRSEGDLTGNP